MPTISYNVPLLATWDGTLGELPMLLQVLLSSKPPLISSFPVAMTNLSFFPIVTLSPNPAVYRVTNFYVGVGGPGGLVPHTLLATFSTATTPLIQGKEIPIQLPGVDPLSSWGLVTFQAADFFSFTQTTTPMPSVDPRTGPTGWFSCTLTSA